MATVDDLHYDERGSGPPLLLIHGTAANVWGDALLDDLASDHRTIAYDRRSFGASPGPAPSDLRGHTDDAAALIEARGAAPATVVGWSIGGVIALDLAMRRPELADALVLIEPPLHFKRRPNLTGLRAVAGAQIARRRRGDAAAAERFLRWAVGTGLPPDWRAPMEANATAIMDEVDLGTGEQLKAADLRRVRAPVVCLAGDSSDGAFQRLTRRTAMLLPNARLERVERSGHCMQRDRPDAIAAAVRALSPATSGRVP